MDKDFLLRTYGEMYGPEAGPWNLSLGNKYLEYRITEFFEANFKIEKDMYICNIGIGAGYWDRYLSYKVPQGTLTSIDIDNVCCKQLAEGLQNEQNPSRVNIICSDVMKVVDLEGKFDIVTMIGSARAESGLYEEILGKAISLLKPNGCLYYQTLDKEETRIMLEQVCEKQGVNIAEYLQDEAYGFKAKYWKITKVNAKLPDKCYNKI